MNTDALPLPLSAGVRSWGSVSGVFSIELLTPGQRVAVRGMFPALPRTITFVQLNDVSPLAAELRGTVDELDRLPHSSRGYRTLRRRLLRIARAHRSQVQRSALRVAKARRTLRLIAEGL